MCCLSANNGVQPNLICFLSPKSRFLSLLDLEDETISMPPLSYPLAKVAPTLVSIFLLRYDSSRVMGLLEALGLQVR